MKATISPIPSIQQFFEVGLTETDTHINAHIREMQQVLIDALYLRCYDCSGVDNDNRLDSIINKCSSLFFTLIELETVSIHAQKKPT